MLEEYLPCGLRFLKIEEAFLVEIDKYGTHSAEDVVTITWATADNKGQTENFCCPYREALLKFLNRLQDKGTFFIQGDLLGFRYPEGKEVFRVLPFSNKKREEVLDLLKKASGLLREADAG